MKKYICTLPLLLLNIFVLMGQKNFEESCEMIIKKIASDNLLSVNDVEALDRNVAYYLSEIADDGHFPDVDYGDKSRTNWKPMLHLDKLYQMVLAYVIPDGSHFQQQQLYEKIVRGLEYWNKAYCKSANWWYNQVGAPRLLGKTLVVLRTGGKSISDNLENSLLQQMKTVGGNPSDPNRIGANKADIALHWLYRGCLQQDKETVDVAVREAFAPLSYTTLEGIQYDNSYFQHNQQLYIGGYASVLISRIVEIAWYTVNSDYELSGERLNLLSKFVRDTFLKCIRGKFMCYNVMGRGISRKDAINQKGIVDWLNKLKLIDKEYATEYENVLSAFSSGSNKTEKKYSSFTHYYVGDFSIFQNVDYSFGVRTVSERTYRSEEGNGENLKGYFLSDGSTVISVTGNEYENIFPVWDWCKIPGTTCPQMDTIPRMEKTWTHLGESDFVGGVSDGDMGVVAYKMNNDQDGVDVSAKKAWFFLGKEVVCLGSDISTSAGYPLTTTLNQCLLSGNVYCSEKGQVKTIEKGGSISSASLDWILHNKVGYFFPQAQSVSLKAEHKIGNWHEINETQSKATVHKDVFCAWLDHGKLPYKATYSYIVVPNVSSVTNMQKYKSSDVEIIENSAYAQAVKHKGIGVTQIVFYQSGQLSIGDIDLSVDKGCIIMIKENGKQLLFDISDPSHKLDVLNIQIRSSKKNKRTLQVDFSDDGYHKGRTHSLQCNYLKFRK